MTAVRVDAVSPDSPCTSGVRFSYGVQGTGRRIAALLQVDETEASQVDLHVVELLEHHLKPGRIPSVVRTPADALDGQTILAWLSAGRGDELHRRLAASFDWSSTA